MVQNLAANGCGEMADNIKEEAVRRGARALNNCVGAVDSDMTRYEIVRRVLGASLRPTECVLAEVDAGDRPALDVFGQLIDI
jgi:hypothetical protein